MAVGLLGRAPNVVNRVRSGFRKTRKKSENELPQKGRSQKGGGERV